MKRPSMSGTFLTVDLISLLSKDSPEFTQGGRRLLHNIKAVLRFKESANRKAQPY